MSDDGDDDAAPDAPPTLKYQRLGADATKILKEDAASCLSVHDKFLTLGTRSGAVHMLDLNGNEIRKFSPHSAAVNAMCIDASGEHLGSCSQDGTVVITSLYTGESNTHWYHRPVRAIALDANYAAKKVFATGGLAGQLVLSTRGWFGVKDQILHAMEGPVTSIALAWPMLAWANDVGVKVFDVSHNRRVSYVERQPGAPAPELFRCHLRWESPTELLIGWADSVKVGQLRTREAETKIGQRAAAAAAAAGRDANKYLEILVVIQTDFYVCGLGGASLRYDAGGWQLDLLVLAYLCEAADEEAHGPGGAPAGGAQRPELRLLTRRNDEVFSDALSLARFEDLRASDYALVFPPPDDAAPRGAAKARSIATASVTSTSVGVAGAEGAPAGAAAVAAGVAPAEAEEAPELTAYVLCPHDLVVARSLDVDDRMAWYLKHGRFEQATAFATQWRSRLVRHKLVDVAEAQACPLQEGGACP
jgi:hypothetical protein